MPRSIDSPSLPTQQLRHFTNREKERDVLKRLRTKRDGPLPVVMFYGVGGAGKSWLLGKLKEELAQECASLPTALLDLDPRAGGTTFHTDYSRALAAVRQKFHLTCPRFDLAYAWIRHKEGITDEPLLQGSGPAADAFELVKAVASVAAGVPGVGHGIKKLGEYLKKRVFKRSRLEKWFAENTGQEDFLMLRSADPQQLYPELTDRLLRDLKNNLEPQGGCACRAVIFIDTFEAISLGLPGRAQRHEREAWVRNLHVAESPVLLVLAGRDRLVWDECDPEYADEKCLEQHLIGGLSEADSRTFLQKCGITDISLQDTILRTSEDTESEAVSGERGHHPLSLGLCADAVLSDRAAGRAVDPATFDLPQGDLSKLAQRFLKSLSDTAHEMWVPRLALTPRFDEAAGQAAFSPTPGAVQDAAWRTLLGYSFVQNVDEAGWHTLHARMREALVDRSTAANGHRYWRDYWQGRSKAETDAAASLAWYHGWRLDPEKAADDWTALAQKLRRGGQMAEHFSVIEWWEPTGLLRRGPISQAEARILTRVGIELFYASRGNLPQNLRKAITCYEAALKIATEATFAEDWAYVQNNLGLAYWKLRGVEGGESLSDFGEQTTWLEYWKLRGAKGGENLQKAFECYEKALTVRTETVHPQQWGRTQNNLGSAYWYGPDENHAENLQKAAGCFEAALRVFTEAASSEDWAMTQNNLGTTYRKLAEIDPRGGYLRKAASCYEASLRVNTELTFSSRWATTQDNMGTVYRMLRDGNRGENLRKSIACYEAALRVRTAERYPADWGETNWNLGLALNELTEETGDQSYLPPALAAMENAVRGYLVVGLPEVADEAEVEAARIRGELAPSASETPPP